MRWKQSDTSANPNMPLGPLKAREESVPHQEPKNRPCSISILEEVLEEHRPTARLRLLHKIQHTLDKESKKGGAKGSVA